MKWMKQAGSLIVAAMVCAAMSITSLAAANPVKTELASYRTTMKENNEALRELREKCRQIMTQVTVLQNEMKTGGDLTEDDTSSLAELSENIRDQRKTIGSTRDELSVLRKTVKESSDAQDVDAAKEAAEQTLDLQTQQLEQQQTLTDLLQAKLEFLNSK